MEALKVRIECLPDLLVFTEEQAQRDFAVYQRVYDELLPIKPAAIQVGEVAGKYKRRETMLANAVNSFAVVAALLSVVLIAAAVWCGVLGRFGPLFGLALLCIPAAAVLMVAYKGNTAALARLREEGLSETLRQLADALDRLHPPEIASVRVLRIEDASDAVGLDQSVTGEEDAVSAAGAAGTGAYRCVTEDNVYDLTVASHQDYLKAGSPRVLFRIRNACYVTDDLGQTVEPSCVKGLVDRVLSSLEGIIGRGSNDA